MHEYGGKDEVDLELESLLSVFSKDETHASTPQCASPSSSSAPLNLRLYRWQQLSFRVADKIGDSLIDTSSPAERGWHTSTTFHDRFVVVFGGLAFQKTKVPKPFSHSRILPSDLTIFSDVCIYDCLESFWSRPKFQMTPPGRFGHAAAALNNCTLLIFGGRNASSAYLNDTWLLNIDTLTWSSISTPEGYESPSGRAFSSAVGAGNDTVILFGGTDGEGNFGESWCFSKGMTEKEPLHWRRIITGGLPPSPRYGHSAITITDETFLVIGGCAVSPQSEVGGSSSSSSFHPSPQDLPTNEAELVELLQESYRRENIFTHDYSHRTAFATEAITATGDREAEHPALSKVLALHRQGAVDSGTLHLLEREVRQREINLTAAFQRQQLKRYTSGKKARHPMVSIDIYRFNTVTSTWTELTCRGKLPSARMHFGAFMLKNSIILYGGTPPSSLSYHPNDDSAGAYAEPALYILDLIGRRWGLLPPPRDSVNEMDGPIQCAKTDILRAEKRLSSERSRGFMLGAVGGLTTEVAECSAVLEVCHWRLEKLLQERSALRDPPPHRWGCTLIGQRQRALLLGGWTALEAASHKNMLVVDFEDELERQRRQEIEFLARLERDAIQERVREYGESLVSCFELEARIRLIKEREAREVVSMVDEDTRSGYPPLFQPAAVKAVRISQSSVWLEWEQPLLNTRYHCVGAHSLTYYLYKRINDDLISVGDRVFVSYKDKHFPAKIETRNSRENSYTVCYESQLGVERRVPRSRITKIKMPKSQHRALIGESSKLCTIIVDPSDWTLIYTGSDTFYACSNLVSDYALEKNKDFSSEFTFALQIHGLDYPLYEMSLLSAPTTVRTSAAVLQDGGIATAAKLNPLSSMSSGSSYHTGKLFSNEVSEEERGRRSLMRRGHEWNAVGTFDHFL